MCSETYQYYTLPFCAPREKKYQSEGFGEVLAGDRSVNSLYEFEFKQNKANETLCTQKLAMQDVERFRKAVEEEYYFQVCTCFAYGLLGSWTQLDRALIMSESCRALRTSALEAGLMQLRTHEKKKITPCA